MNRCLRLSGVVCLLAVVAVGLVPDAALAQQSTDFGRNLGDQAKGLAVALFLAVAGLVALPVLGRRDVNGGVVWRCSSSSWRVRLRSGQRAGGHRRALGVAGLVTGTDDGRIVLRSYRLAFELERRIHRIDRYRIPLPYGLPLVAAGYGLATAVLVVVLSGVPVVGGCWGCFRGRSGCCSFPVWWRTSCADRRATGGRRMRRWPLARLLRSPRPAGRLQRAPRAPREGFAPVVVVPDERGPRYRAATVTVRSGAAASAAARNVPAAGPARRAARRLAAHGAAGRPPARGRAAGAPVRPPLTFAWRNVVFGQDLDDAWGLYRLETTTYAGLSTAGRWRSWLRSPPSRARPRPTSRSSA
jgi:hypothetical protein